MTKPKLIGLLMVLFGLWLVAVGVIGLATLH
jgi:hypothetical protein